MMNHVIGQCASQGVETVACWCKCSAVHGDTSGEARALLTLIQDALLCEYSANFVALQHLALFQCLHSISAGQIAEATIKQRFQRLQRHTNQTYVYQTASKDFTNLMELSQQIHFTKSAAMPSM